MQTMTVVDRDRKPRIRPPTCRLLITGGVLLLLALPLPLLAQESSSAPLTEPGWTAAFRLGPTGPRGALGELTSNGWIGGAAVERHLLGRGLLRAELAVQDLGAGGAPEVLGGVRGPEVQLYHYTAGLGVELTDPAASRWDVSLLAGAGGTHLVSEESPALPDFSGHRPTVRMSGRVGYDFLRSVTLYLRADAYQLVDDAAAPAPLDRAQTLLTHSAEIRVGF